MRKPCTDLPKPPYLKYPGKSSERYENWIRYPRKVHPNYIDWNIAVIDFDLEERQYNFGITLSHALEYKTVNNKHVFLRFTPLLEGLMFSIKRVDSAPSFVIVNKETTQEDFGFLNPLCKKTYVRSITGKFFECALVGIGSRIKIPIPSKFLNGALRRSNANIALR